MSSRKRDIRMSVLFANIASSSLYGHDQSNPCVLLERVCASPIHYSLCLDWLTWFSRAGLSVVNENLVERRDQSWRAIRRETRNEGICMHYLTMTAFTRNIRSVVHVNINILRSSKRFKTNLCSQ